MLKIDSLRVSYGHIEVLKGISFSVEMGEIVALIGGNGAGKTTTLSTISGLVRPTSGTISWKGENIQTAAVEAIVGSGLAHCPEGRRIFPGLTVLENLVTGTASRSYRKRDIDEDLALVFDRIVELNKRTGLGVLLVEQNSAMALEIASRAFALETGTITLSGPSAILADDPRIREAYLGH